MYSFYYNRILRSSALICVNPDNPLPMIATSEIISVFGPVLNPDSFKKIIAVMTSIMYMPTLSSTIITIYYKERINNNKTEAALILLFMLFYLLYNDISLVQYIK